MELRGAANGCVAGGVVIMDGDDGKAMKAEG